MKSFIQFSQVLSPQCWMDHTTYLHIKKDTLRKVRAEHVLVIFINTLYYILYWQHSQTQTDFPEFQHSQGLDFQNTIYFKEDLVHTVAISVRHPRCLRRKGGYLIHESTYSLENLVYGFTNNIAEHIKFYFSSFWKSYINLF